jgi:uncharacterized RDD family membrane protein YckC
MTAETYVNRVLDFLPRATPRREQIAMELRGHIAERTANGLAEADILRQLGDPKVLAESYLSAVPLRSATFGQRAVAKLIDVAVLLLFIAAPAFLVWQMLPEVAELSGFAAPLALIVAIVGGSVSFAIYQITAETLSGQTLGKRALNIRVVRESGARIGVGQAIVRQLPLMLEVFWIDVLFALFTEKSQRAFEMLSKTRVVRSEL